MITKTILLEFTSYFLSAFITFLDYLNGISFLHFKILFFQKVIYAEVCTCLLDHNFLLGRESQKFLFSSDINRDFCPQKTHYIK